MPSAKRMRSMAAFALLSRVRLGTDPDAVAGRPGARDHGLRAHVHEPLQHRAAAQEHAVAAGVGHAVAADRQDVALDDGRCARHRCRYRSFSR